MKDGDFIKAHNLKEELTQVEQQLKRLQDQKPVDKKEKRKQNDTETMIRCLDILIALLKQPCVNKITPALQTYKDMMCLKPFNLDLNSEVFWRVLKILVLFCIIDKNVMKEYNQTIFRAVSI